MTALLALDGLAPIDGWALLAIAAKSFGYAALLGAMGGPLFLTIFRDAPDAARQGARRIALLAAGLGLLILALRFGIQAARLSGMGMAGGLDPTMLGLIWNGPLGTMALWQAAGTALILALLVPNRIGRTLALCGVLLLAIAQTRIGHALGEPQVLLASLLTIHLLAVAFWVGALAPLHSVTAHPDGPALLRRFGSIAVWIVAVLITAGAVFAWRMTGSVSALFGTAYGLTLLAKIAVVTGLLALAALNKLRLVPALAAARPGAPAQLRRSITWELVGVAVILIATATLTSVTVPPANL